MLLTALSAHATSWTELTVEDPIKPGSECAVNGVVSYGGYVFNWPSKYDQIFFPYTSSLAIWYCSDSGFISFMEDFEQLTADEKTEIAHYLAENPQTTIKSLLSKLELLEVIYSFRTLPAETSNRNKRILAYLYEQINEFEKSNSLRSAALQQIYQLLNTDISDYQRLKYLYVAANYERQLGRPDPSDVMAGKLLAEIDNIQEDKLKSFGEYLLELAAEIPSIEPGHKLAPPKEKEPSSPSRGVMHDLVTQFPAACHPEIEAFSEIILPMFSTHFHQTLLAKKLTELLDIRQILIHTGQVPHDTLIAYHQYKGIGAELTTEVAKAKLSTAQACLSEIEEFYELFLLQSSTHIAAVVTHIASLLTGVRDITLHQETSTTLDTVDQNLIKHSIYYLYCYVTDYDVTEHIPCPEKSIHHKDIFLKLQADITQSPLQVADEDSVQKLLEGLASLGI